MNMNGFEFVSHESFPEDEYTKEAVTICIEKKHRVIYLRKKMQTGAMFWDVISAAVKQNGEKKYLKSYSQDSNFLQEDIKHFLDSRSWETKNATTSSGGSIAQNKTSDDEFPF